MAPRQDSKPLDAGNYSSIFPQVNVGPCEDADVTACTDKEPFQSHMLKQHKDMRECVDSWMTLQRQLLEDLLMELLFLHPPQEGMNGAGRAFTDGQLLQGKKVVGAWFKHALHTHDTDEPALCAVQRKNKAGVTWNLSDERAKNRIAEANKRSSLQRAMQAMDMASSARHEGATPLRGGERNPQRATEISNSSQAESRGSDDVGTAVSEKDTESMAQYIDQQREAMAQKNRQVFFYGRGRTSQVAKTLVSQIVRRQHFDQVICLLIGLSALMVGAEVQICAQNLSDLPPFWLQVTQAAFSIIFTVELILRWWVEGRLFLCRADWQWNAFDFFVVVLSDLDLVVGWFTEEGHPILVVSRMIRIIRIVRIIRVVRFLQLQELKMMIFSIFHTLKSLMWSLVLMLLMMYLFSAYLTQATVEHLLHAEVLSAREQESLELYWNTLPKTAYTLFLCMSGGVSWGDPVEALFGMHWSVRAVFLVYISFMLFAFLNVITGFFCVSASDLASGVDRELIIAEQIRNKQKYKDAFHDVFKMMDIDGSGDITLKELEANFQDPDVAAYFSHLNLDIEEAWDIFKLLDDAGCGAVQSDDFVDGCLRLRGSAKTIDVATLGHDVKRLKHTLSEFMYFVHASLEEIALACKGMPTTKKVPDRSSARLRNQLLSENPSWRNEITWRTGRQSPRASSSE